jgi:uncharacterized protein with PIN domain
MEVAHTPAYYDMGTITATKSLIVEALEDSCPFCNANVSPFESNKPVPPPEESLKHSFVTVTDCKKRFVVQNKLNILLKIFLENT